MALLFDDFTNWQTFPYFLKNTQSTSYFYALPYSFFWVIVASMCAALPNLFVKTVSEWENEIKTFDSFCNQHKWCGMNSIFFCFGHRVLQSQKEYCWRLFFDYSIASIESDTWEIEDLYVLYLNRKCRFRLTLGVMVVHKNFKFVNRCKIYSKLHWGWVGQSRVVPSCPQLVMEVGLANNSRISVNPITIKSKNLYKTPYKVLRTRRTSIHKLRIYRIKGKDVCQGEAFLAISVIKNNHNIH